jgi:hypothetical protein
MPVGELEAIVVDCCFGIANNDVDGAVVCVVCRLFNCKLGSFATVLANKVRAREHLKNLAGQAQQSSEMHSVGTPKRFGKGNEVN